MVNAFTVYDLTFLVVFTLAVVIFLYTHKKNLQRQGLMYLYRTRVGINFIDKFAKKYEKILRPLQYVIVTSGYLLMAAMLWMLVKIAWIYLSSPTLARDFKVPVIIPLIPYLPSLFKLDFLPAFNFTYWIIIIAIIAIPHEFAHGIFARLHKLKVHSTGFGFLGPFLAAFVEPDEKQLEKAKIFPQLSILAAGTFANVLSTIFFGIIFWLFFISSFTAAGVNFNAYATSAISLDSIDSVHGAPIASVSEINTLLNSSLTPITSNGVTYYAYPESLEYALSEGVDTIQVLDDSPAFNTRLQGAISEIDGAKITSYESLIASLESHNPGDTVEIKTKFRESIRTNVVEDRTYEVTLSERDGKAYLGIGIVPVQQSGITGAVFSLVSTIKDPFIFYESSLGSFGWFIYYFLWWTVLICISVALVNMLPVGMFDGGRFFYLTVLAITKNKSFSEKAFKFSTYLILAIVLAMMIKWAFAFI